MIRDQPAADFLTNQIPAVGVPKAVLIDVHLGLILHPFQFDQDGLPFSLKKPIAVLSRYFNTIAIPTWMMRAIIPCCNYDKYLRFFCCRKGSETNIFYFFMFFFKSICKIKHRSIFEN